MRFHLMEKLGVDSVMRIHADPLPGNQPFHEQDFEWLAEWGFDFVRLPIDYRCWVDPDNPARRNEKALREIDQAVDWGRQYGVHVCLNQHTAPGYRVDGKLDMTMVKKGQRLDRAWLERTYYRPWKKLAASNVGVQVGEWGVLDTVPHDVALHWMHDVLGFWKDAGWGWAVWNLRGEHGFGPLDMRRADVQYENFHGHRLDRAMLEPHREF